MTKIEAIRAYGAEPVLATLVLSLLSHIWSFAALADFMHAEARDVITILEVLLAASFALWIGLFWVSNTEFGSWLSENGELENINNTYIFTVVVFLVATLACLPSAYLTGKQVWVQNASLWIVLVAFFNVSGLLNNTRNLLRLHAAYGQRSQKLMSIKRGQVENGR
jgi:hypothetical protein